MMEKEKNTELTKNIILVDDKSQNLCGEIGKVRSVFRAVHYAIIEGGIDGIEIDAALSGISVMLDTLEDNAEEAAGFVSSVVKEVM